MEAWYGDRVNYNYSAPGYSANTERFTQTIWHGTTQLGTGFAARRNGNTYNYYVVNHYYIPGNQDGKYVENVKPKTS